MSAKQSEERELADRFLREFGHADIPVEVRDRPDFVALIDGKRIGIEVTQFHADEQPSVPGSVLRVEAVKKVKDSGGQPCPQWGVTSPMRGLVARINAKIVKAAGYDNAGYEQLWLLISSQIPKIDAVAPTFVFAPFLNISALNDATHTQLCGSSFTAVHIHLMMSHGVYSWSRLEQWHITKVPRI